MIAVNQWHSYGWTALQSAIHSLQPPGSEASKEFQNQGPTFVELLVGRMFKGSQAQEDT